jgi:mono/diheme cytochrome c family protein
VRLPGGRRSARGVVASALAAAGVLGGGGVGALAAQRPGTSAPTAAGAPHAVQPHAVSPHAARVAERLLAERLSCMGCHQLQGRGGVLAPPLDGVSRRRDPAYIAAMVLDPQRMKPGALMPRPRLLASERALVIRYLGGDSVAGVRLLATRPSAPAAGAPAGVDGAAVYRQWCAGCHGARGGGDGPNAKSLPVAPARHDDAAKMALRTDDALYDTIDGGGAIMNRSARMPAFGATLSPAEVRALVRHIRQLCRCEGPAWSRDGGGR